MDRNTKLIQRLNAIAEVLSTRKEAIALVGVGSAGKELERMDEYSDIDFFVTVEEDAKESWIADLGWINEAYPLAYTFKITNDGFKVMFEDGIYGEFAVFTMKELHTIPYASEQVIWKKDNSIKDDFFKPQCTYPAIISDNIDYAVNEALTNLYVGLCRFGRGEKLSAAQFIQNSAVNQILSILPLLQEEQKSFIDPFNNERRIEFRFPNMEKQLGTMIQGYEKTVESAESILNFLRQIHPLNEKMESEIKLLIAKLK